jgi:hypothetical protein
MSFTIRVHHRMPLTFFSGFMLLIALLMLNNGPAYAEWVKIYEDLPECPTQKGGDEWQPVAKRT